MDDSQHLFPLKVCKPLLGEPSLGDAIAAIKADTTIPEIKRRHWLTSLTVISKAIGRPPESILCRMTSLRHHIGRLNAAALGWEQKTIANHKSNLRAAINHFAKVKNLPKRGALPRPEWKVLTDAIRDLTARRLLSGLSRYCSVLLIPPSDVHEETVIQYFRIRETTGFLRTGVALPRQVMKAWNSCVEKVPGWPRRRLSLPGLPKATKGPELEKFPESLRLEIEAYLTDISKPHRSANGRRRRSNKPSTILTRRREIIAYARTAVAAGVSIESLTSLKALLHPDVVKLTFETYLDRNGEKAKAYTIDLAWKLASIAKTIDASLETVNFLDDVWARLEHDRGPVLTHKNQDVIRSVLMTDVWGKVCVLPQQMMSEAKRMLNRGPKKAVAMATTAIQIQILTRAPIRIGNLLAIRFGVNLTRDMNRGSYRLHFPDYDTKNRVDLDFTLTGQTAVLIEEFINVYRPFLGEGHKSDWLFPGENDKQRSPSHASAAIAVSVNREVGLRLTAHQFRHAAVAVIMKSRPGDYEFAARLLGHRNVETTKRYYSSLESFNANGIFGAMIEEQMYKNLKQKRTRSTRRKTIDPTPPQHRMGNC